MKFSLFLILLWIFVGSGVINLSLRKENIVLFFPIKHSSSSIGTATLVGFGLLNYRWVFSAGRFLQSALASGTSNPQLGGSVVRTFQLSPPGVPHTWNDASEPQQRKVEIWARNFREFCRKVATSTSLLGPTALLPLWRKACWGFFRPKNPTATAGFEPAYSGTNGQHAYL